MISPIESDTNTIILYKLNDFGNYKAFIEEEKTKKIMENNWKKSFTN